MRRRRGLILLAIFFLAWELFAAHRWIRQAGGIGSGFGHLRTTLRSDWMALIVVSDHLIIASTVLVFLLIDAAKEGWRRWHRFVLAVAFIGTGSPALLLYIAWRTTRPGQLASRS
jgi:hypothetical protein